MKTYENYIKYINGVIDKYDKFLRKYKISYLLLDLSNNDIIIDDLFLVKEQKYYDILYIDGNSSETTSLN